MKHYIIVLILFLGISEIRTQSQASTSIDESLYAGVEWRHIGPFRGGRSCAVTGVPGKPNLFYMGSTGGGVWKTTDGGQSWENISDGYFGGSIGSVAVSLSDQNVIYVGGGEKTVRGNVSYGYGIWKSVDGGKSWESKGLKQSRHISRIRIHPDNPNIAFAAVMGDLYKSSQERGVYKTTDGGDTWQRVLFANADAGAVDLVIDPNNSRNLFASTWRIRRNPYSLSSGGDGSGLWKSTDSGNTWTEITGNEGLPEGTWGISGVTVSPVNSDRVWALIENEKGGVYRSDDGGETWTKLNESRALRQRAWYYTRIYADTQDEDIVYVVNVRYHKSKDGGKTFSPHVAPHGDHHDLWIAPEDNQRMIIADDGGAQVSFDGGEKWSTYHNQPTAQFYRVTTDNHEPYRIYVAQQDNSTIRIAHRSSGGSIGENDWESTAGGESAHLAPDPLNPEIVYGGSYGGFLTRKDHSTGTSRAINVWPDNPMGYGAEGMKYRFQWNFPIFFSKHNPKKLYTASNHLHVSTNEGQSWEIISPDLTRNDPSKLESSGGPITKDNTGVEYYCTIFAVDESPITEGVIWAGSDDGLIHLTQDGGENWTNVTPRSMPEWLMINSVHPDPFNEAGCYVAGTLYKAGDYRPYLYKTSDWGKTWTKIVNGIPSDHFTRVVRADSNRKGLLYAGTETGMYISFDDGAHWNSFQQNLPIVPITDLALKNNNLIAATQGRSIWIIDDLTILHSLDPSLQSKDIHLFKPLDAARFPGSQNTEVKGAGVNHPSGVAVHYLLNQFTEEDSVALSFHEPGGITIRSFSNKAKEKADKLEVEKGANSFIWNMRYPAAKEFEGMIMWWGSMNGAKAPPGEYTVRLTVNGENRQENSFNILPNPQLDLSQADYDTQFDYLNDVNQTVSEAHQTIIDIRELKKQLQAYKTLSSDQKDIVSEIDRIDSLLTNVETDLYQTKNQSRQDPLNFPIKLTNKLAHLNSLTGMGDYPPTSQALVLKEELKNEIMTRLDTYNTILNDDVPQLNTMIKMSQIDAIKVPKKKDKP